MAIEAGWNAHDEGVGYIHPKGEIREVDFSFWDQSREAVRILVDLSARETLSLRCFKLSLDDVLCRSVSSPQAK